MTDTPVLRYSRQTEALKLIKLKTLRAPNSLPAALQLLEDIKALASEALKPPPVKHE